MKTALAGIVLVLTLVVAPYAAWAGAQTVSLRGLRNFALSSYILGDETASITQAGPKAQMIVALATIPEIKIVALDEKLAQTGALLAVEIMAKRARGKILYAGRLTVSQWVALVRSPGLMVPAVTWENVAFAGLADDSDQLKSGVSEGVLGLLKAFTDAWRLANSPTSGAGR